MHEWNKNRGSDKLADECNWMNKLSGKRLNGKIIKHYDLHDSVL